MAFEAPILSWHEEHLRAATATAAVIVTGNDGCGAGELALAMAHRFCGAGVKDGANPDLLITLPQNQNISVAAAREVIEFLSLAPVDRERRVAVILRADCMNDSAANALLKTLEEPHPQKSLVLWTRALQQLPPTIISRCHIHAAPPPPAPTKDAARAAYHSDAPLAADEYPDNWHALLAKHFAGGAQISVDDALADIVITHDEKAGWQRAMQTYLEAGCRLNAQCVEWEEKSAAGNAHRWLEGLIKWVSDGIRAAAALPPVFFPSQHGALQALAGGRQARWCDFYNYLLQRLALAAHPLNKDLYSREILNAYQQLCAR